MDSDYLYDVAFSFLKEDEELATRLDNLLKDRLSTFLYSRRQEELAGTDGEIQFGRVFGEEARVVVVLYRDAWGKTPWTRIEETAIRNRAHEEGYDLAIFMPLDTAPTVPRWLPKPRIWIGLDRWGVEGAAAVIEARAREAGGEPRPETVVERAGRLARKKGLEAERAALRQSNRGVEAARVQAAEVLEAAATELGAISAVHPEMTFRIERQKDVLIVFRGGYTLRLLWQIRYSNVLEGSMLSAKVWRGILSSRGNFSDAEEPLKILERQYEFDLSDSGESGWREQDRTAEFRTSRQVAAGAVMDFLDSLEGNHDPPNWGPTRWR